MDRRPERCGDVDLVTLDLNMPQLDGLQLLEKMREKCRRRIVTGGG